MFTTNFGDTEQKTAKLGSRFFEVVIVASCNEYLSLPKKIKIKIKNVCACLVDEVSTGSYLLVIGSDVCKPNVTLALDAAYG